VTDVVPKAVSYRLLSAALRLADPVRLQIREDRPERLVAELATGEAPFVDPAPYSAARFGAR